MGESDLESFGNKDEKHLDDVIDETGEHAMKTGDHNAERTAVALSDDDTNRNIPNKNDDDEEEVPMTFPQRLMEILSNDEHSEIISWLPHGRGFMIYQKKRFATEVMPKYFKKSKFTSFTRKLNRWNFTRITRGCETGAYYHECFQRGNLRLCMQMCCQNSKNIPMTGFGIPGVSAPLPAPRVVGDAMSRLCLGPQTLSGASMRDLSSVAPSMGILQNQLGSLQSSGINQPIGLAGGDENIRKLRQLEHQRDLLLAQQEQDLQQQEQQQFQQKQLQQQQQLAALGLNNQQPSLLGNSTSNSSAPDVGLGALQQSNTTAYLAMLMAQEKVQAQLSAVGGNTGSIDSIDVQRQQLKLLQAQQQQLENYSQQLRLLQAQAALQQQNPSCVDGQANGLGPLLQHAVGQNSSTSDAEDRSKKGRYSAAA